MRKTHITAFLLLIAVGVFLAFFNKKEEETIPELSNSSKNQPSTTIPTDSTKDYESIEETIEKPVNDVKPEETPTIIVESEKSVQPQRATADSSMLQPFSMPEAAAKFIPKEERRPGNLGGPPPFEWPPKDMNLQ